MDNLLRFEFNQRYTIFDAETEGLNLYSSRPWQLSWIKTVGKKIIDKEDFLLRYDDLNVSEGAARVTGFDKKEYFKNAVDPFFVGQKFLADIADEDVMIVGHNILNFDIYIIQILRRIMGLPPDYSFMNRLLDTRPLFFAVTEGMQKPDDESLIEWQYKILNMPEIRRRRGITSLPAMLKYFDIPYEEDKLHDSLYDIELTAKCLFDVLNKLDI